MKIRSIRREIQILRVYALLSTIAAGAFLLGAVHEAKNASFDTITVHRISLVDNDGTLRLAISNKDNFPPPIMHGKPFGIGMRSVGGSPSFVFYNAEGDEQGGFRWDGTGKVGGKYSQFMNMSFDQFEQNDDLVLNFGDSNAGRSGGLELQEQSQTTPLDVLLREMQAASAQAHRNDDTPRKRSREVFRLHRLRLQPALLEPGLRDRGGASARQRRFPRS